MKITIETTSNGAFITYIEENGVLKTVYNFTDENPDQLIDMIHDIQEHLDLEIYDKFSGDTKKIIVKIVQVHGHKYADQDEENHDSECKLCKNERAIEVLEESEKK